MGGFGGLEQFHRASGICRKGVLGASIGGQVFAERGNRQPKGGIGKVLAQIPEDTIC